MRRNPAEVEAVRERFAPALTQVANRLEQLFPGRVSERLKSAESIREKLTRKSYPLSQMTDVAGVRVVLPTMEHLWNAVRKVRQTLPVLQEEDYITTPKGYYRSYHFLVESNGLPVEVQLKTPRMLEVAEMAHFQLPLYKEPEAVKVQYGKSAKKLRKYFERMAEHYYTSDIGLKLKRPKIPTAWKRAGLPSFTMNPWCCGVRNRGVRCGRCGKVLVRRVR